METERRAVLPVIVWRGGQSLPTSEQGIRVLGTPLGHGDHVEAEVLTANEEHSTLLSRILVVRDLQCAWLLALPRICQGELPVAVVHPSWSNAFARAHNTAVWNCFLPNARDDGQSPDVFREGWGCGALRGMVRIGPIGDALRVALQAAHCRELLVHHEWVRLNADQWTAFALSIFKRCTPGCDGVAPSSAEVVRDHRYEV